ncbi:MAG TPA: hypothetical protein VL084_00825 [Thermoanaerobaculia bacterium]|nr:hypothetical protein [Thermoanaerobaculia bacterium]
MTRLRRSLLALLAGAALAAGGTGCRRAAHPAPPAAPPPSGAVDTPEARAAREKRATAVAGFPAQAGIAAERCPVLRAPDFGAPVAGTLEEGAEVEVILAEPGFFGVRTANRELAFVPARSIRLLPGPLETPRTPRPRREILPQINPLPRDGVTPAPGVPPSPSTAATPLPAR